MSEFKIQTAQNVTIEQNLAGIGQRIFAFIIDIVFLILFYYFLLLLLEKSGIMRGAGAWAFFSVLSLPYFLYYPIFQYWNNGQTLGKQILKIRVVKIDNTHPRIGDFLIRWVIRLFEVFPAVFPGLALLVIVLNDKKQRLGDIAAKTTVVSEAKKMRLTQSIFEEIEETYQPQFEQVQKLTEKDLQLIKDAFYEAKKRKQIDLLRTLTRKLEKILGIKKPADYSHSSFIETILKDYNYYSAR